MGGEPGPPSNSLLAGRHDVHDAAAAAARELDDARAARVERVILADPDALTGLEAGAALAHDDLAAADGLAGERLDPEELRVGVAAVAGGAEALLVCHLLASLDVGDLDARQLLTMPGAPLVAALGLELEHAQLGPRMCSTTFALTVTFFRPSLSKTASSERKRIGSSATVAPASSGSSSTSRVCPGSTRDCLPPVLTISYMAYSEAALAAERRRPPLRRGRLGFVSRAPPSLPPSPSAGGSSPPGPPPLSTSVAVADVRPASSMRTRRLEPTWGPPRLTEMM